MSFNPWANDDGDEDTDNPKVVAERNAKVANALIMDARANMFAENANGEIPLVLCLKAAVHNIKNQLICEDTDYIGIYFAGVQNKSADSTFDNIYVFHELDAPAASLIRKIDSLIKDLDTFRDTVVPLGEDDKLPLASALWSVNLDLAKKKLKESDSKAIWIFTNDDEPFKGDEALEKQCIQRAHDGSEQGHEHVLWCMNKTPGVAFDPYKFYGKIIEIEDEEDEAIYSAGDGDFSKLLEHIRRKAFKKRVLGRFSLSLGRGIELAVGMYCRILPLTIATPRKLDAKTNAPLECRTRWFCSDTTSYLLNHEIKHYIPYGGHKIFISKDEMKAIKDASPAPGISLVGFRPMSALKDHHNLRTGYFLYPDENEMKGATTAFAALHAKMLQHDRFGVALLSVSRRAPKLVALVAQSEERDEDGFQIAPPGINVILLPFADDIRNIAAPERASVDSDALKHAEAVVSKLDLPEFDSINFENPKVQRHYAGVQALALLEDFDDGSYDEHTVDATLPDVEGMKKRAGDDISALAAAVGFDAEAPAPGPAPKKRSASSRGGTTKKAKPSAPVSADDIKKLAEAGTLKKRTVAELKAMLTMLKLDTKGKKADLVERIEEHFDA